MIRNSLANAATAVLAICGSKRDLQKISLRMNTVVTGWKPFSNPRMFAGYGRQRGWEREISDNEPPDNEGGFVELSEEEVRQLELPKEWIA